ncbi:LysR family transcriptional regulator [Thalassotalea marina]|uniref:LysR family transcriptional regulator n=1 Tax=Thalassotalea marina TaxID=1673741 RepID=A0A919BNE6_9GAMM|nr:LysR family transcriptional regulator [Thalassotalea marina]GHG00079.1 LysR family transcriptional regulator [Thalassotalea marina]
MEFYHLRSFVAVAQTGNLTKAAQRLYSTPPAISAHIKALEHELATQLFVRSSKGMALTAKGEILLEQALHTLDSAQHMVNLACENATQLIGHCHIGLNQDAQILQVTKLAQALVEHCPGIQMTFSHFTTGDIIEQLESGQLDAGYVYGALDNSFYALTIMTQRVTTITPANFDTSSIESISDLANQTWISVGKKCPFDLALTKQLPSSINFSFASSNDKSRVDLVCAGLGLSFVEEQVAIKLVESNKAKRITLLDFDMPLYFAVRKQRIEEPIMQAILQEVRILWQLPYKKPQGE